jgi:hypothetical protein
MVISDRHVVAPIWDLDADATHKISGKFTASGRNPEAVLFSGARNLHRYLRLREVVFIGRQLMGQGHNEARTK